MGMQFKSRLVGLGLAVTYGVRFIKDNPLNIAGVMSELWIRSVQSTYTPPELGQMFRLAQAIIVGDDDVELVEGHAAVSLLLSSGIIDLVL